MEAAAALYRQILAEAPGHPAALTLLGTLEAQLGHKAVALPLLEAAAKADPRNPDTQLNLGALLSDAGQLDRAITHLKRAISLRPDHVDSHFALANALGRGRSFESAEKAYRTTLRLSPGHANARNNLGNVLLERGRPDEALVQFDETIKRAPRHLLAWHGKARAHEGLGDGEAAEATYRRLIDSTPGHGNAWNSLGLLLEKLGRTSEAVDAFRQAAALPSDNHAEILSNLGCALADLGHYEEAAPIWRQSIALRPDPRAVSKLYDHTKQRCLWDEAEQLEPLYRRLAAAGAGRIHPYPLLMAFSTKDEQLAAAKISAKYYECADTTAPKGKRKPKLTIGYLSPDFRQHAVAQLMAEIPELHDREKFSVVGLSTGPDDGSEMRTRIASACDLFLELAQDNDRQAADRIRAAEIDILVDLAGHTKGGRLGILGRRPAPINVTWLGYPGSSGGGFIDYLIADSTLIPRGEEGFYSEAVVRLPHTYQPNDRKRPRPDRAPARSELGLPDEEIVFASFTQNNRLNRPVFALWMSILSAMPDSVLWLLGEDGAISDRLRDAAGKHGVAGERIIFAPNLPLERHLARYNAVDVVLDPFPYNAHTTTSDALWMGRPVVTRRGETFASRVAASLLQTAALPELITNCEADYLAQAIELAGDPSRRARIREHLWQPSERLPIFNAPAFARHLERAYAAMWERHLNRQKPTAIDVKETV